jgi:hypothetical protein
LYGLLKGKIADCNPNPLKPWFSILRKTARLKELLIEIDEGGGKI